MILLERIKGKASIKPANLFFIELIIILVFFGFSAAVILRIFAAADARQKHGDLTEKTLICAQSVAEAFSVSGSVSETIDMVFGNGNSLNGTALIRLSEDMKYDESGSVSLELTERNSSTEAGCLSYLDMKFIKNGDEIYSLTCCSYIPDSGGASYE